MFWDTRIPHANAYRNDPPPGSVDDDDDGAGARVAVYCSFLPDVAVNRRFVRGQREDWRRRRPPREGDRWGAREEDEGDADAERGSAAAGAEGAEGEEADRWRPDALGERLLGLVDWD